MNLFRKKKAKLESLDIYVTLKRFDFYFDYGLIGEDHFLNSYIEEIDKQKKDGFFLHVKLPLFNFYLIGCSKNAVGGWKSLETAIRAHEETHFLDRYGKLGILEKRMKNKGKNISFHSIEDREVRANIGCLYALDVQGRICEDNEVDEDRISLGSLRKFTQDYSLDEAMEIYFGR